MSNLFKPVLINSKEEKFVQDLKTISGHQIYLKWNYCLQKIKMLNIYYA